MACRSVKVSPILLTTSFPDTFTPERLWARAGSMGSMERMGGKMKAEEPKEDGRAGMMKGSGMKEGAGGMAWGTVGGEGTGQADAQMSHQVPLSCPHPHEHLMPPRTPGTRALGTITITTHTAESSPFSSSLRACAIPGPISWRRPGDGPGGVLSGV